MNYMRAQEVVVVVVGDLVAADSTVAVAVAEVAQGLTAKAQARERPGIADSRLHAISEDSSLLSLGCRLPARPDS